MDTIEAIRILLHPLAGLYPPKLDAARRHLVTLVTEGQREGICWRCRSSVSGQIEIAYLDANGRSDCPEAEDGLPHEIDPPE